MRCGAAITWALLAAACQGKSGADPDGGSCTPACSGGLVCRYDTCVPQPMACSEIVGCSGDQYCDVGALECLPWGVGPGGNSDRNCRATPVPGVLFPGLQCEWAGPPAGDAFPDHVNVLATPMVATFGAAGTPSIVFPSYNATDRTMESCTGTIAGHFGVIRVIDGRTCEQQATIAMPTVIGSASVAIADLGGADSTPEIVAARSQGGLVAFTRASTGWKILWETPSTFAAASCDWAGPSIHDLDDDGLPEVLLYGAVYNGQTGAPLFETFPEPRPAGTPATVVDSTGVGYIPVVTDVDGDGVPELITGSFLYAWDKVNRLWKEIRGFSAGNGMVAVGDFGTFPATGQDDRTHTDGIAETVVVWEGVVHVFTVGGREVFAASFQGIDGPAGHGGPPTVADFDGDGRVEIGAAGRTAYQVFDPDCRATPSPTPTTCASLSTNGVLWVSPARGDMFARASSSAFDFEGDGRAEAVFGDQCFTRVYDGATGKVLASRARTSCTWFENPVIADTDGDFNAELITTSNRSCVPPDACPLCSACPAVDPLFDGAQCMDDTDCASPTHCGRDQRGDALGRCRCTRDPDCGEGFTCADPIAGAASAGKVCRASHPMAAMTGVRVLADTADRWVSARPIWNQHAYSVTNIEDAGNVPRTSRWLRNWTQAGLNTFRASSPDDVAAANAIPDLTVKQAKATCDATAPTVSAEVCNRGNVPVAPGVPVAVYASTTPSRLRCQTQTAEGLVPGGCTTVSCTWIGASGDGAVVVDDRGNGSGVARECREDNNAITVRVSCP